MSAGYDRISQTGRARRALGFGLLFVLALLISLVFGGCGGYSIPNKALGNAAPASSEKKTETIQIGTARIIVQDQYFIGRDAEPKPVVILQGKTLQPGTDYTVSYLENRDPGTAWVKITGKGVYRGSKTAPFEIADPAGEFVTRLYRACLGREPDADGFSWWTEQLRSGDASVASCAWGFFGSEEFQAQRYTRSEFLDRLYRAFLDRKPAGTEKQYWQKQMKNGMTREEVVRAFAAGAEFAQQRTEILLARQAYMTAARTDAASAAKNPSAGKNTSAGTKKRTGSRSSSGRRSSGSSTVPKEKRSLSNSPFSDPSWWGEDGRDADDDGWMYDYELKAEEAWLNGEKGWYKYLPENEWADAIELGGE